MEMRNQFILTGLKDLKYPIMVEQKSSSKGLNTIAEINIFSAIQSRYEGQFEKSILDILNRSHKKVSIEQLSNKLMGYLVSINSAFASINFKFPIFIERRLFDIDRYNLMTYHCEYSIKKTSSTDYKKLYKLKIPIVAEQYLIPGIQSGLIDIPVTISIEIDASEIFFIEDIIEIAEKNIKDEYYKPKSVYGENINLDVLAKINAELNEKYNSDYCFVKISNKKSSHSYLAGVYNNKDLVKHKSEYEEAHLFI